MPIIELTYYKLACDCCGEEADYGDYSAWSDPGDAVTQADPYFQQVGDDHLCDACWCWPEDLPDYPGDDAWTGTDDPVRKHVTHPASDDEIGRGDA